MSDIPLNFYRRKADKLPPKPHPHDETEPCPGGCEDILIVEENACKLNSDISELDKRIQVSHDQLQRFEARLTEGGERMGRMETTLAANTSKLDKNTAETSEILDIMREGETFFRLARRVGEVFKWILAIATAVISFWVAVKGWPK